MGLYDSYIFGGEGYPRVVLLDENEVALNTLNLNFTDPQNGFSAGCRRDEKMAPSVAFDRAITGKGIGKKGGFFFRGRYDWSQISLSDRNVLATLLTHRYFLDWYPHYDNTDVWFKCEITDGDVMDPYKDGSSPRPFHRGHIVLEAVRPHPHLLGTTARVHFVDKAQWGAYSAGEKLVLAHFIDTGQWGSYTTAEQALSQFTDKGGDLYRNGKICLGG